MPVPFGGREDRDAGPRFPIGPDGTVLIVSNDPNVMQPLPDHLALHGDALAIDRGDLADPTRATREVLDEIRKLLDDGLLGDKPELLARAVTLVLTLVALRYGIMPTDGVGMDSSNNAKELDPGTVSLLNTVQQHARVRAVVDMAALAPVPGLLGGLRQRKHMFSVIRSGLLLFGRGIVALENRIDPLVRTAFTATTAFENVPEIWDMLEPLETLIRGAAVRGQKTRDLREQAKKEGYATGFSDGKKAAEEGKPKV